MGPTLVLLSGVVAFCMAWAIGAQDVSNALGTSVGSKALTVRQAIVVGAICEFLGSLVGGEVAATISGGILNMEAFHALGPAGIDLYANCMFVTMCGAFTWLVIATIYGLPVSTTHSLVGSLVGVGCVAMDPKGVNWESVGRIVSSWLSSPLLGGIISYAVFSVVFHKVLTKPAPPRAARLAMPYFTGFTVGLLAMFVGVAGPRSYRTTASRAIIMGILMGCISGAVVSTRLQAAPDNVIVMANAADRAASGGAAQEFDGTDEEDGKSKQGKATADASRATDNVSVSIELAEARFKPLMVVTACVVAFAHGSNDVSNSIGPFNALVEIYNHGTIRPGAAVPLWVLICGGVGIVAGLGTYGYKVMATVGEGIAKLTFSRGFAAQIATAATVLTATQVGVSVSTTHCLIGAIAGVAMVEGPEKLNKATLKKIAMSWIITLPAAAFGSVVIYTVFQHVFGLA